MPIASTVFMAIAGPHLSSRRRRSLSPCRLDRLPGAAPHQALLALVAGQFRRRLECGLRLAVAAEPLQQIAAHAGQQMIGFQGGLINEALDDHKAGLRTLRHADGDGPVQLDHRRGHQRGQLRI